MLISSRCILNDIVIFRTVAQMRHLVDVYKRIFGKIAIRVLPHVQAHYDAMMQLGAATKDR